VQTNLSRPPKSLTLEVAPETSEAGAILYFKVVDLLGSHSPEDCLTPGKPMSAHKLAKLLAGSTEDPPGDMKRLATALRERWLERGLLKVEKQGNAKMMFLQEDAI
jgi:hypothetical protein